MGVFVIIKIDDFSYKVRIYQKRPKHSKYNIDIENLSNRNVFSLPNNTPYILKDKLLISLCYKLSYDNIFYYVANDLSQLIYACYNCTLSTAELIEKYKQKNIIIKIIDNDSNQL